MSESGDVYIYDLLAQYKAFDTPGYMIPKILKDQYILSEPMVMSKVMV